MPERKLKRKMVTFIFFDHFWEVLELDFFFFSFLSWNRRLVGHRSEPDSRRRECGHDCFAASSQCAELSRPDPRASYRFRSQRAGNFPFNWIQSNFMFIFVQLFRYCLNHLESTSTIWYPAGTLPQFDQRRWKHGRRSKASRQKQEETRRWSFPRRPRPQTRLCCWFNRRSHSFNYFSINSWND